MTTRTRTKDEKLLTAEAMLDDLTTALSKPATASYWNAFIAEDLTGPGKHVSVAQRDRCRVLATLLTDAEAEQAMFDGCLTFRFQLEPSDRMWAGGHCRDALLDEAVRRGFLRIDPPPVPSLLEESCTPNSPSSGETLTLIPLERATTDGSASRGISEAAWQFGERVLRLTEADRETMSKVDRLLICAHGYAGYLAPARVRMLPEACRRLLAEPLPQHLTDRLAQMSGEPPDSCPDGLQAPSADPHRWTNDVAILWSICANVLHERAKAAEQQAAG